MILTSNTCNIKAQDPLLRTILRGLQVIHILPKHPLLITIFHMIGIVEGVLYVVTLTSTELKEEVNI